MRIYWYWPHPHRTPSPLVLAARRPGDELTIHALSSLYGETFGGNDEYEVVRTVPDPTAIPSTGFVGQLRPARLALARSRARSEILGRGFDVGYLSMLFHHTDWAEIGRLRRRVPLVSHVHDVLPHRYRLPSLVERAALRRMYRNAGHLVVYHGTLRDELVADFGIDPDLVHVVPHPLDARRRRERQTVQPERPVLLNFGRLRRNKGVEVLLDALDILGPGFDAEVVIAGGGDPNVSDAIRTRLRRLPHVHLELNYISNERKHELFSRASWLILPYTTFHSQSGVLADAYSYRLPLIVSDVGALGPTVRDDGSGIVVPPGNAHELALAMAAASEQDTSEFETRIDRVAQLHDHAVVGPQLRAIFDQAVGDR